MCLSSWLSCVVNNIVSVRLFSSEKPGKGQAASDYKNMAKMFNDVNA